MRFLCLPGAYGSAEKFKVQLEPFTRELESDGTATFHFIHGPHPAHPPKGYEAYFGSPPYFRFIDHAGNGEADLLATIRDFPPAATAEDAIREVAVKGLGDTRECIKNVITLLFETMERDGPFDGIIGYSEGATIAGTMLLADQKRHEEEGKPKLLQYGLFFAGWPPMSPDAERLVLADECDLEITVPTCHVVGSLDPYLPGSIALYNTCDPDTAYLFDHGKGHTLPRDAKTIKELGDVIRKHLAKLRRDGLIRE